jgi:integrase
MAKKVKRLSPLSINTLTRPGRHADGDNLYLVVNENGSKSWSFLYRWQGRTREAGLGSYSAVPLKDARAKAAEGRGLLQSKPPIDPLTVWRAPERTPIPTFEEVARGHLDRKARKWRNPKHKAQTYELVRRQCGPIAHTPVNEIKTAAIFNILAPIWEAKFETASRLRGIIEGVFNAAKVLGHIDEAAPNPARWKGHLDQLLSGRETTKRRHFAAMPYADVPAFVAELQGARRAAGVFHVPAYALEFLILTVARSSEALGAQWSEIDWEACTWVLPGGRMKAAREHVVPLSEAAMAVLANIRELSSSPLIFPGARKSAPMAGKAFERLLQRMGRSVTTHGFRSSFRDWAGDKTEFAREVAEAALAHAVGDETERAYRRGSALEKRRALMEAWAAFVMGAEPGNNVVPLKRA